MNLSALVGRVLLATVFMVSGIVKLVSTDEVRDVLLAHYLSAPESLGTVLVLGSGLLEVLGAGLLILGLRTRLAVAVLILTLLPATFLYHSSMQEENQVVHFLKNASILGGLLLVGAFGPGGFSLDARRTESRGR